MNNVGEGQCCVCCSCCPERQGLVLSWVGVWIIWKPGLFWERVYTVRKFEVNSSALEKKLAGHMTEFNPGLGLESQVPHGPGSMVSETCFWVRAKGDLGNKVIGSHDLLVFTSACGVI